MFAGRPDRHEHRRRLAGLDFHHETGDPVSYPGNVSGAVRATPAVVRARAARAARARAPRRPARARAQRATCSLRCGSTVGCRSRVGCGCGGCASSSSGRCSSTVAAKSSPDPAPGAGCGRSRSGTCAAACSRRAARRPRVRLQLRRLDARAARTARPAPHPGPHPRHPRPLRGLPASISRAGRPLELETRLSAARPRRRADHHAPALALRARPQGRVHRHPPDQAARPTARPGLAVRLGAPRMLASGRRATVRVTVANQRRRRPGRVVSSLWHLRITGAPAARRAPSALRSCEPAGRARALTVPVPRPPAGGSACVSRPPPPAPAARARRCARSARAPPVTG